MNGGLEPKLDEILREQGSAYKSLKDCQGSSCLSLSDDPSPASASSGDGPSDNSPQTAPEGRLKSKRGVRSNA
jgi:hypothetical protein